MMSRENDYEIFNTSLLERNEKREMFRVGANSQLRKSVRGKKSA